MFYFLLLLSCSPKKYMTLGVVDIIESSVCVIQMPDESMIAVDRKFCRDMREGDIIVSEKLQ